MADVLFLAAVQRNGKPNRLPEGGVQPEGQGYGVTAGVFDGVCGQKSLLTNLICDADTEGKWENFAGIFVTQRDPVFLVLCHMKGLMVQIAMEVGAAEAGVHRQGILRTS